MCAKVGVTTMLPTGNKRKNWQTLRENWVGLTGSPPKT